MFRNDLRGIEEVTFSHFCIEFCNQRNVTNWNVDLPGHPIRGRILFQTRETRSTAGFDRNIRHGLQRGFREWNTKRKTRLETTCPTRNSSLSHLTRRQKRTKSKGALHKAMVFYVSRKKHPKKNSTTSATKLKMLQSKLLDRSLCFSIVHIAKQTAQACILRFQCELIQSCKATLQSSPKFFL